MSALELILLFLSGILLIVASIFAILAAAQITKIRGYSSQTSGSGAPSPKAAIAHRWLTWASVVGSIGSFLIVGMVIYYITQASKSDGKGKDVSSNAIVRFFLFLTLIILFTTGIFCAIGAVNLRRSSLAEPARLNGAQL